MMSTLNEPLLCDRVHTNSHKHLPAEAIQLFSCAIFYSLIILQLDDFQLLSISFWLS